MRRDITLFSLVLFFCVSHALRVNSSANKDLKNNGCLTYYVIGDWGSYSEQNEYAQLQIAVAQQLANFADQTPPDFILSVGDNFYEYGVQSTSDPLWTSDFVNIYSAPSLQVPWYIALGNHDYEGIVNAQLQYKGDSRWRLPDRNYTVRFPAGNGHATFIILDTSPFIKDYYNKPENPQMAIELKNQDYKKQMTWFKNAISSVPEDDWIIVAGHHAIYAHKSKKESQELQTLVVPLLEKFGAAAYFSGHVHDLEHHSKNNIDYFISGAGSRVEEDINLTRDPEHLKKVGFHEKDAGFMLVQICDYQMNTTLINMKGDIVKQVITPKPSV